jgi:hypothetical protein
MTEPQQEWLIISREELDTIAHGETDKEQEIIERVGHRKESHYGFTPVPAINITPLKAVYEKFKHLDKPLSDTLGCKTSDDPGEFIHWMAGEMWRAIKEAVGEQK